MDGQLTIHHGDLLRFKDPVMAELQGRFVGFLTSQELTDGKEFKSQTHEVLSCSKRYVHVFDTDDKSRYQIVVYLSSLSMKAEFGVYDKKGKKVIHTNTLEDLRYKISSGAPLELIDSHHEKFEFLFKDFQKWFEKIKGERGR